MGFLHLAFLIKLQEEKGEADTKMESVFWQREWGFQRARAWCEGGSTSRLKGRGLVVSDGLSQELEDQWRGAAGSWQHSGGGGEGGEEGEGGGKAGTTPAERTCVVSRH